MSVRSSPAVTTTRAEPPVPIPVTRRLVATGGAPVTVLLGRIRAASRVLAALPPEEVARARRMPARRASEYAHGRLLLRHAVQVVFGSAMVGRLAGAPPGRPYLIGTPAGVSLSHSGDRVVAAVWPDGDVGVDVQRWTEPVSDRLLRRCCGREAEDLPEPLRTALFARSWTVQEACAKVQGRGLASGFWRRPVDPVPDTGTRDGLSWHRLAGLPDAALAVAWRTVGP